MYGYRAMAYTHFHGEHLDGLYVDQVIREYFPDYTYKGVFFDIGAFDPIHISNSYHFEKNGWDCYLFEANTELIPRLKEHRKNVFNYALYDEDKESIEFNVVDTGNWTAGFSAIELNKEYEIIFPTSNNKEIRKVTVPQRMLDTVIQNEIPQLQHIDVMSVDIEGGELKMLKGFDLAKYPPKLIVIENVTNDSKYAEYLSKFNYRIDKHISYNQYFVHNSYTG
jgi:FkbM family methyltransferase